MGSKNTGAKTKAYHIRAAGLTDVGCVRERNEDAFLADVENRLFVVADGVGGHAHGDIASRMVVELLPQIIKRRIGEISTPQTSGDSAIQGMLAESVSELSQRIHVGSKDKVEYKDMGATVVVALLTGRHAHIVHMGDSRAYLFRRGRLRKLTEDHSIINLLMHNGEISAKDAKEHPAKGRLTRFVGMEAEVDPGAKTLELKAGDRLLLCTDGLWGMVPDQHLRMILTERKDPETTCRDLVTAGKGAGGQDNLTVIVADIREVYDQINNGGSVGTYTIRRQNGRVVVSCDNIELKCPSDCANQCNHGDGSEQETNLSYAILRHYSNEATAELLADEFASEFLTANCSEMNVTTDKIQEFIDFHSRVEGAAQNIEWHPKN